MRTVTAEEINEAIRIVETAKQNHPIGYRFLNELGLPGDALVAYALSNAEAHAPRLGREPRSVIYATGWLQGLAVGTALTRDREGVLKAAMEAACDEAERLGYGSELGYAEAAAIGEAAATAILGRVS